MRLKPLILLLVIVPLVFLTSCQHGNINEKVNVSERINISESPVEESPDLILADIYSNEEEEEIKISYEEMMETGNTEQLPDGLDLGENVPHLWPVKDNLGHISSWFGSSRSKGGGGRVHKGVDIIVPQGTPVISTADGVVRLAGKMSGYGLLVVIEHNDGIYSAYAHLSQILVSVGDMVKEGQSIGLSGATGRVTTAHLHYEVRKGEKPLNPLWFLPAVEE